MPTLTIFCNADLPPAAAALLRAETGGHQLLFSAGGAVGVLGRGAADPLLDGADVVFGQPDVEQLMSAPAVRWVQLSSAGYTRYDRPDLLQSFRERGAALTKSSLVYDEACALHVLAFVCAEARQLTGALTAQRGAHDWPQAALRARSRLLRDERAVIVGFGSIARRLVELLAPLRMQLSAIRQQVRGDEPIATYSANDPGAARALAEADHVIDILPDNPATARFFDRQRISTLKSGAIFYNIGRGSTVDEDALQAALSAGHLSAAYLDVTATEPLPPAHPLWTTPRCYITPHTAGGHQSESTRLVQHFLDNLGRFISHEPLLDQVV